MFNSNYAQHKAEEPDAAAKARTLDEEVEKPLPFRFQNPDSFENHTKRQHPLYMTSNNMYGARIPVAQEMPTEFHGRINGFSDTFTGGMYRDFGLNTASNKSRVGNKEDFGYY